MKLRLAVAALAALALAVAASGAAVAARSGAAADTCRNAMTSPNWRAVFAHDASQSAAKARLKAIQSVGYRTAKIENRGCNDYATVLESPSFSQYSVRASFAAETVRARYQVSYAAPGNAKAEPGDVRVIFGHAGTLAAADKLRSKVAASGWRETDVAYGGPGDWQVVWPFVPSSASDAVVAQALKLGLMVELDLAGH